MLMDAQCHGESTTSQPPNSVLVDANEKMVPQAVSIAPSRRRSTKSSVFLRSASFRSQPVDASSYSSASGALGPGYRGGQFIEWLGRSTLNAVEASIIIGRMQLHRFLFAKWSKARDTEIEADFRKKGLTILEDALEMSK